MFRTVAISFLLMVGFSSAAAAEPVNLWGPSKGTTYFNQPGADIAKHERDLKFCLFKTNEANPGVVGAAPTGGFADGLIAAGQRNYIMRGNVENCMVVHGWRVVQVSGPTAAALVTMDPKLLAQRLAIMVGSPTPEGVIVRSWANDATTPDSKKGGMMGVIVGASLSLRATPIDRELWKALSAPPNYPPWDGYPLLGVTTKHKKNERLPSIAPDSAVLFFTFRSKRSTNDTRISMFRQAPDRYNMASSKDGLSSFALLLGRGMPQPRSDGREETFFVTVPPGRWVLSQVGELMNFCMGGPAFEARAGDVIFAGAFDYDKPGLGPDLSLDSTRALLAKDQPQAAAALKPAEWTNGETFRCAWALYALEFPEFPSREGYIRAGTPGER